MSCRSDLPVVLERWRRFRRALKAEDQPAMDVVIAALERNGPADQVVWHYDERPAAPVRPRRRRPVQTTLTGPGWRCDGRVVAGDRDRL